MYFSLVEHFCRRTVYVVGRCDYNFYFISRNVKNCFKSQFNLLKKNAELLHYSVYF